MKHFPRLRLGLLALSLGLTALPVWADDDCDAPVERWQSREAVRQMAARQGWKIQRLKIDDGCYEIRGTNAQGRAFKAKIDPETLQVLEIKHRDRDRDRDRDDDDDRKRQRDRQRDPAASQNRLTQPDGAAAPSPLFTPGTAPRGQID